MKHKADPIYKYEITVMESERGWGQDFWKEYFDTHAEAAVRIREINSKNTAPTAPDYYIQAFTEVKKVEVDRDGKPC